LIEHSKLLVVNFYIDYGKTYLLIEIKKKMNEKQEIEFSNRYCESSVHLGFSLFLLKAYFLVLFLRVHFQRNYAET